MKKMGLYVVVSGLLFGGIANAHDEGGLPPPLPNDELESIRHIIRSKCGVFDKIEGDKIECMIDTLHSLKEEGGVCEEAFRFLLRDLELQFAYFRGKSDAETKCLPPPPPGEGNGNGESGKKKVELCHIPPGNPDNAHTIRVSQSAVEAHLAHGDILGPCESDDSDDDDSGDSEKEKEKKKEKNKKDKNKNGNKGNKKR